MTKRLPALAGLCLAIGAANYVYLQAFEAANAKPVSRSRGIALQVQSVKPAPQNTVAAKAVINRYCITCHNEKLKTAGLMLDTLDVQRVGDHAELWERVARKFRTGEMPPPGMPRPDKATYAEVTTQLETALDSASAANLNPGRVAVHRLNRTEYTAAIRDLLGLEVDGRALLSADDADQEGFDNVASVLSVSPVLLENYLSAARKISRLAVGDLALHPAVDTYKYSKLLIQDDQMSDELPFGSQGGALIRYQFPLDGDYTIKVQLRREHYEYLIGMGEPHQIDIRLDGVRLKRFTVGGEAKGMTTPENFAGNTQGSPEFEVYMHTADAGLEVRIPVKAGEHEVSVSFVRRFWEPEGVLQPPQIGFGRTTNEYYHGNPSVEYVYIGGPYGAAAHGDSLSRRKIFVCAPKDAASEEPCAKKILSTLAARAYRRPVTDEDVKTLLSFYAAGREEKDFDEGIHRYAAAADRILPVNRVKPHTCFHGPIESGCTKMAVVGFGKQPGAAQIHSCGPVEMRDRLLRGIAALRETGRLLGGLATVESAAGDVVRVEAFDANEVGGDAEHELLDYARTMVPALPFPVIDVLIIDQGGKDISGTTLDPNVTGRFWINGLDDAESPRVSNIVLLGITPVSGGNVLGIGLADFIPASLANTIDWHKTYVNCFTAGASGVRRSRMPMVLPDEESCIKAALSMCGRGISEPKRVVRIISTLHMTHCWVSDAILDNLPPGVTRL